MKVVGHWAAAAAIRLSLILIIPLIVISSPVLDSTLSNTVTQVLAYPAVTDTSNNHSSLPMSDDSSPSMSSFATPTTQATVGSLTARPTNNIVNTNSFYDIVFRTATSGAIKTIQVTFPAGTTVPSSASFNEAEGIGSGTVTKSGQTLTYTVTNAVNVPAGTKIRLEFANINNPLSPSANYKVTVTTRNAANIIIDGPTQSTAYTIKQIGVNVIADLSITSQKLAPNSVVTSKIFDNAVDTSKIEDGSITSTKIADDAIIPFIIQRSGTVENVSPNTSGSSTAQCFPGEQVVGGGYSITAGAENWLRDEFSTGDGWAVEMFNPSAVTLSFFARAECMPALP